MRKLIVFGNGLGRALSNDYYDLGAAMRFAWADDETLDDAQRDLIRKCLPRPDLIDDDEQVPGEHHLDNLQRVLAACDEISKFETDGDGWLNERGRSFPNAIRSFIHRTASYFHEAPYVLPTDFIDPLLEHVRENRSHVATLNYDELLYRAFVGTDVFNGYSCLIDGFVPSFDASNLIRWRPDSQSFYLHLHGSPLYFENASGELRKSALRDLPIIHGYSTTHIVLTEVQHKFSVIQSSEILKAYWSCLKEAIREVDSIVLVGYGGHDTHLNQIIRANFHGRQIEIVERSQDNYCNLEERQKRQAFWKHKVGTTTMLHWPSNLCEFSHWNWRSPENTDGKYYYKFY